MADALPSDTAEIEPPELPELFAQLDAYGARFVLYGADKIPRRPNGVPADVAKPATWCTLDEALAVVGTVQDGVPIEGVGFVIDVERDLADDLPPVFLIDIDGCIGPDGKPGAEAAEIVAEFDTYAEVSRSGGGLHVLPTGDPPPRLDRCKLTLPHGQKIEVYRKLRYVALTGKVLDGCTGELCDATEALERLAARVNQGGGDRIECPLPQVALTGEIADAALIAEIEATPLAGRRWRNEDGLTDGSAADFRLALDLWGACFDAEQIEAALRAYPHGQIGAGIMAGKPATARAIDRQVARCIAKAMVTEPQVWDAGNGVQEARFPDGTIITVDWPALIENGRRKREARESAMRVAALDAGGSLKAKEKNSTVLRPIEGIWADDIEPSLKVGTMDGLIGQLEMAVMYGGSNVGKSFVAINIACHIALGIAFRDMFTLQGTVVYIAAEAPDSIKNRFWAWRQFYNGVIGDSPLNVRIVTTSVNLMRGDDVASIEAELVEIVAQRGPISLIVVDTLAMAMVGDENKGEDMATFVRSVRRLIATANAAALVVHHSGKDEARGARGHSSLRGATDVELEVTAGLLRITKGRDIPKDATRHGFELSVVPIGVNAVGREITTCVATMCDPPEEAGSGNGKSGNGKAKDAKPVKLSTNGTAYVEAVRDAMKYCPVEPGAHPETAGVSIATTDKDVRLYWRQRNPIPDDVKDSWDESRKWNERDKKARQGGLENARAAGLVKVWGKFQWLA